MTTAHTPDEPAFPGQYEIGRIVEYDDYLEQNRSVQLLEFRSGMTLRDYFAARAMLIIGLDQSPDSMGVKAERMAERAYLLADAMMRHRSKETT